MSQITVFSFQLEEFLYCLQSLVVVNSLIISLSEKIFIFFSYLKDNFWLALFFFHTLNVPFNSFLDF